MITEDEYKTLHTKILSTLRGRHATSINFSLGSYHIDGTMFSRVADYIEAGKIFVGYSSAPGFAHSAEYNSTYDLLWVGFKELKSESYGLLIHECVHAAMDADFWKVNVTTSEALAYIAQAMYIHRAFGRSLGGKPYHVAADSLAQTLENRGTPTVTQVTQLKDALLASPKYSSSYYAKAQFNGIQGMC
jgi:hypothetical protein